jgi:biotin operon repressor
MTRSRLRWNDEQIALLRTLAEDEVPLPQIALRLDRTRVAVTHHAKLLKIKVRPG